MTTNDTTTMTPATVSTASAASRPDTLQPHARRPTRAVAGGPRVLLRLEGALLLGAGAAAYANLGGTWVTFALLFLLPDLSMLGYLRGPRVGAFTYNAGHSLLAPGVLAGLAGISGSAALLLGACIWLAHIGFDRMLGYGLKYASDFHDTHLGRVGRLRPQR